MSKDYKETLNIPDTQFSMRANLSAKEADFRAKWLETKLYKKVLEKNKSKKPYILHDGPPYANGDLHIGHALNKILKDFIVRYKNMSGFYSPYIPGWDMHGLPIEHKMLTEMNIKHTEIDVVSLRKKAAAYAEGQLLNQKEQFQKLQLLSDFEEVYKTLDPKFEAQQLRLFKKMYLKNLVYKGLKPVYWSPSSLSALADAEVEYAEKRSPSIYVAFELDSENELLNKGDYLVIWTTTPWTLVANAGVAFNSEVDYVKLTYDNKNYVVASVLVDEILKIFKWENVEISAPFKGTKLKGLTYKHPLNEEIKTKVVAGHHVETTTGTGLVHMAPFFGEDDFIIGKENKLVEIMHVADDGTFNEYASEFKGLFYEDANKVISQKLKDKNQLLYFEIIKHQYPHDWRTHKPIIYRGTPQWFVDIEKIKQGILGVLEFVKGYPYWVVKRLSEMIAKRGPWTISRQRSWGVPIIIFYDQNDNVVNNEEIFDYVIDLVEKHGSDIWYEKTTDELLPEKYRNLGYKQEKSIMDVWFDSGSTSIGVDVDGKVEHEGQEPFDLYLEGTDQFRGWFNSSIINSYIWRKAAPYKFLLSHGFVLDGKNQKMSKSKGNVITPEEVTSTLGADILRLWVSSVEYSSDVSISMNLLKQVSESYRKIRNTIRFMIANLEDYEHDPKIELTGINLLIDERLKRLKNKVIHAYEEFSFVNISKQVNNFLVDLSSYYLSYAKDILYADKANSKTRREIQYNLFNILDTVLIAIAPILPTTAEEAYSFFKKDNKKESIHLEDFFKEVEITTNYEEQWAEFFALKDKVFKEIELAIEDKKIKRSNEAFITIETPSKWIQELNLDQLFLVAQVTFADSFKLEVKESYKCPRCWNHHLNKNNENLCKRCADVLK
ncbi:isoleucine--tRNA ligase [Mycoplasmopsis agassizii]|uniref:isoleucine--tRNA ligase n=1 Tax=Mycoplasmopsis agassizii TaxID=33922 RepID=UPI0035282821